MQIMSKSPSRRIVKLQGKLKLAEKGKHIHSQVLLYFPIFQYTTQSADISDLFERKSRKTLISLCLPSLRLLNFVLRGGGAQPGSFHTPSPLGASMSSLFPLVRQIPARNIFYVWATLIMRNV